MSGVCCCPLPNGCPTSGASFWVHRGPEPQVRTYRFDFKQLILSDQLVKFGVKTIQKLHHLRSTQGASVSAAHASHITATKPQQSLSGRKWGRGVRHATVTFQQPSPVGWLLAALVKNV